MLLLAVAAPYANIRTAYGWHILAPPVDKWDQRFVMGSTRTLADSLLQSAPPAWKPRDLGFVALLDAWKADLARLIFALCACSCALCFAEAGAQLGFP